MQFKDQIFLITCTIAQYPAWSQTRGPDEFRREEGRLEDRRDPRDVGLRVSLGIRRRF